MLHHASISRRTAAIGGVWNHKNWITRNHPSRNHIFPRADPRHASQRHLLHHPHNRRFGSSFIKGGQIRVFVGGEGFRREQGVQTFVFDIGQAQGDGAGGAIAADGCQCLFFRKILRAAVIPGYAGQGFHGDLQAVDGLITQEQIRGQAARLQVGAVAYGDAHVAAAQHGITPIGAQAHVRGQGGLVPMATMQRGLGGQVMRGAAVIEAAKDGVLGGGDIAHAVLISRLSALAMAGSSRSKASLTAAATAAGLSELV